MAFSCSRLNCVEIETGPGRVRCGSTNVSLPGQFSYVSCCVIRELQLSSMAFTWLRGFSTCSGGRRGGQVSGALGHTVPGHVPTEPPHGFGKVHEDFLCDGDRRRGGWVSMAFERMDPGHVPTEPSRVLDSVCSSDGWLFLLRQLIGRPPLFCGYHVFDCLCGDFGLDKLTVSVRQLVLSPDWDSCCGCLQQWCRLLELLSGSRLGVGQCFLLSWHVVVPPCWCGGLLSTPWTTSVLRTTQCYWTAYGEWLVITFGFSDIDLDVPCASSGFLQSVPNGYSDPIACCTLFIGDGGPWQLAGPTRVLQRQILLSVVRSFTNIPLVALSACNIFGLLLAYDMQRFSLHGWVMVYAQPFQCQFYRHLGSCASFLTPPEPALSVADRPSTRCFWIQRFRTAFDRLLDDDMSSLVSLMLNVLQGLGNWTVAICRSGCMVVLCYLCRLLLFGWRLKGGACNCDNLLRTARASVTAAPWQLAVCLRDFSPGQQIGPIKRRQKRSWPVGCSTDLFLLLVLVCTLICPTAAANDRRPPAHPTEFPRPPAYQGEHEVAGDLLRDPDVAEDIVPEPWIPPAPVVVHVTRAYRLFGFGHQPEFISCTTTQTATSQRCLELLEPDVNVARTGGRGALHFLRGPAVQDELQAQWIPSWVHSALGRLVVIDASLLGLTPFQAYVQDGIISYDRVNRLIPELEDSEYYIFVPSQDDDPLVYEGYRSRIIVDHGDVIHLTPDPAPPQALRDVPWAFDHFADWSLTEFADGYDAPVGTTRVLVLSDRGSLLLEAISDESDDALTQRICEDLGVDSTGAAIIRPTEPFERPMYRHHFLSDIVYWLETPLVDTELIVFVDSRPVLQTFSAVRLQHPVIPVGQALDLFDIWVEAVEGYRLWLKGGRRQGDCLVAQHRDTFWVRLEAQEYEYLSDDSSSESSADSGDTDSPGHETTSSIDTEGEAHEGSAAPDDGPSQTGQAGRPTVPGAASQYFLTAQADGRGPPVVTMWNRAFDQDVFVQDRRGDTSGNSLLACSSDIPTPAFPKCSSSYKSSSTLGVKFWLLGMTFLAQIHELRAVASEGCGLVPCCANDDGHAVHRAFLYGNDTGAPFTDVGSKTSADYLQIHGLIIDAGSKTSADYLQIHGLITLLEEAKDDGFFLVCQFVSDLLENPCGGVACHEGPVRLSLTDAIPCTAFQNAAQDLQSFLPVRRFVDIEDWQDWLDCDLQAVHRECKACPAIWEWLARFGSWYDEPFLPEAVHVYTDGSACQDSFRKTTSASWAFNVWALTATKQAYLGHAFGVTVDEHSPFHLGEDTEDALTGEQLALAWAFCWAIEASCAFNEAVFVFHFDSLTAGYGGFGSFKLPSDARTSQPSRLSRSVAILRQCAQGVCNIVGKHVPSHSGFAGNELADVLAKFASKHPEPDELVSRPCWPSLVVRHELSEWAWLAICQQEDLPVLCAFESEARRLYASEARRPFTFAASESVDVNEQSAAAGEIGAQLRLCSLNVLSLREFDDLPQGLAVVGKRALLKQQLLARQLHVIALQETRTQGDCIQPDADFIMLHSSCDERGCFGCAIWLNKALPIVTARQQMHRVTKEVCTVLHAEPRMLAVQIDLPDFPITFIAAHAPHDGHRSRDAVDFWRAVGAIAAARPSGAQLVVLTDSNGHLGSISSEAVGTAGAEAENPAGAAFHAFLVEYGLCLPSTYDELHSGTHCTWKTGSHFGHRLDYIAVPSEWLAGELASMVWTDFDHVHDVDDHQPVLLFCELLRKAERRWTKTSVRAPRPGPDSDPGQLQCFQYAIDALPRVAWQVDADMHYSAFVKSTLWCWSEFVAPETRRRCKPFVSDETLSIIEHRKRVRQALALEVGAIVRTRLLIGMFAFWLQRQRVEPGALQVQYFTTVLRQARHGVASLSGCLARLRPTLRKAIRGDRALYLKRLADGVTGSSLQQPKQLFAAVYKAFPVVKSRRRSGFCPLPAVLLEDGRRAKDLEERMQRWTEHFARQEGGCIVSERGYDQTVQVQAPDPECVPTFDVRCVPTLLGIEQDMLRLRNGKAAGPDLITADLLKLNVPSNSRRLLPIFTKTALACREPVIFKGGCLITLAKKAHASLNCADFRSILLSSVPGKLLHRSMRRQLLPALGDVALPLQAGALPGTSPELLTLYFTAFQRWAQSSANIGLIPSLMSSKHITGL